MPRRRRIAGRHESELRNTRCTATTKNGSRCTRRVERQQDTSCWQHEQAARGPGETRPPTHATGGYTGGDSDSDSSWGEDTEPRRGLAVSADRAWQMVVLPRGLHAYVVARAGKRLWPPTSDNDSVAHWVQFSGQVDTLCSCSACLAALQMQDTHAPPGGRCADNEHCMYCECRWCVCEPRQDGGEYLERCLAPWWSGPCGGTCDVCMELGHEPSAWLRFQETPAYMQALEQAEREISVELVDRFRCDEAMLLRQIDPAFGKDVGRLVAQYALDFDAAVRVPPARVTLAVRDKYNRELISHVFTPVGP